MRVAILVLLLLAGCTTLDEKGREGTIVTPGNFRAGSGVIQSVAVVRGEPQLYRLYLHMDVGGFQSVDTDNPNFMAGDAVELTNDGRVERVSGTSLQDVLKK